MEENKEEFFFEKEMESEIKKINFKVKFFNVIISLLAMLILVWFLNYADISYETKILFSIVVVGLLISFFVFINNFFISKDSSEDLEKELEILDESGEKIDYSEAIERIERKNKIKSDSKQRFEILGGFVKVLDHIRETRNFYIKSMIGFIVLSLVCVSLIYGVTKIYNPVDFSRLDINLSRLLAEGFFSNLRFFLYESLVITFLAYCLKKVSNYISMIEIYKEWEIFLIMDAQRQNAEEKDKKKSIVSKDFQNRFEAMLIKHEDFFMASKNDLKFKTSHDLLKELLEKGLVKNDK